MAPFSEAAQGALIKWVNTFPIDQKIKNISELADGQLLAQVLGDIDSSFNPNAHLHKKNKLQAVIDGTRRLLTQECPDMETLVESPAFKALAGDRKTTDIFELLTFVLIAAVTGEKRAEYVGTMMGMEAGVQTELRDIIQATMNKAEEYREPGSEPGSYEPPQDSNTDIELQLEVRYASILQQKRRLELENDRIRNQMADITTRLEHLQESHDTIRDRLVETEDKLRAPQRDDDTAMFIKRLEDKIREQDELIESQEGQVDQDREEKAKMRRELETLRKAAERTIQLEDELKELRLESIELAKKANTADRFKQKLEAQKALENDLKNVEYENEELRSMLRDFNKIKARNESLEQTHLQFQNSIAKAEMEIFEIHSQKKHLDMQKAELESALEIAEARRAHDEQFIADLQEQIQTGLPERAGFSLEDELETEDATQKATSLEISRLRAEIAALKSNAATAQESGALLTQLEEAMAYRKVIEAKYRDAFEKEAISQQQLRLMMSSVEDNTKFVELAMSVGRLALLTPEYYRHQAFIDLKHAHGRLTDDLANLKKKYDSLNEEHQETQRELVEKASDLSMVGKDELDKLAEFKSAQESLVASFEAELTALKSKNKALEIDYDLQKTHLQESILLNDKLRNTLEEEMKDKKDSKAAVDADGNPVHEPLSQKTEKEITALQNRIRELEEEGSNDAEKAALQKENANLKREYGLMTMAWYDLSSRVQSNTVMLQRRSETSKSWINKQRHVLNPTGRR